jgi:hypothetical protein
VWSSWIDPEELEAHYRARTTLKVNVDQRRRRRCGRVSAVVRIALFVTCFNDTLLPETANAVVRRS